MHIGSPHSFEQRDVGTKRAGQSRLPAGGCATGMSDRIAGPRPRSVTGALAALTSFLVSAGQRFSLPTALGIP
jgi:hypothetical protein